MAPWRPDRRRIDAEFCGRTDLLASRKSVGETVLCATFASSPSIRRWARFRGRRPRAFAAPLAWPRRRFAAEHHARSHGAAGPDRVRPLSSSAKGVSSCRCAVSTERTPRRLGAGPTPTDRHGRMMFLPALRSLERREAPASGAARRAAQARHHARHEKRRANASCQAAPCSPAAALLRERALGGTSLARTASCPCRRGCSRPASCPRPSPPRNRRKRSKRGAVTIEIDGAKYIDLPQPASSVFIAKSRDRGHPGSGSRQDPRHRQASRLRR